MISVSVSFCPNHSHLYVKGNWLLRYFPPFSFCLMIIESIMALGNDRNFCFFGLIKEQCSVILVMVYLYDELMKLEY